MKRALNLGERFEDALSFAAQGNPVHLQQLRSRFRHGVFGLHMTPDEALNYTFALTASSAEPERIPEIPSHVDLHPEEEYASPEHAIVAAAEYSGMGYEVIPAMRAAWRRGVQDPTGPKPFYRVSILADQLYDSIDADLLPKVRIPTT